MARFEDSVYTERVGELIAALVSDGVVGFERKLEELARDESDERRHRLVVLCADRLVPWPRHRGLIINHLARAIEHSYQMGDIEALLLGLTAAAQIQLSDGVDEQVPALLNALDEMADRPHSQPYSTASSLIRAQQEFKLGNAGSAAEILEDLVGELDGPEYDDYQPLVLSVHGLRVQVASAIGHLTKLKAVLRDLEKMIPGSSSTLVRFHCGVIAEAEGRLSEAIFNFETVVHSGEDSIWAIESHLALARLIPEDASVHLEQARELAGRDNISTAMAMIRAALRAGRHDEARREVERLRQRAPNATRLFQAEVYCTVGPFDIALERVNELMQFAKQNGLRSVQVRAHLFAAQLAESIEERVHHIGRARRIALDIDDQLGLGRAYFQQAMTQLELGYAEDALANARSAIEIAEVRGRTDLRVAGELALGLAYQQLGDEEQGRRLLESVLDDARRLNLDILASRVIEALGRLS